MDGHFSNDRVRGIKLIPQVKFVIYEKQESNTPLPKCVIMEPNPSMRSLRHDELTGENNNIQPNPLAEETHTNLTHTHCYELSSNKLTDGFGSTHTVYLICAYK